MKYEMPVLTDEQREELIKYASCVMSIKRDDTPKTDLLLQIALAALTAEVRGSLIQSVNPRSGNVAIFYRERGINSISPEEIAEWEMSELDHLYTAPPVPVAPEPDYQIEYRISQVTAWVSVTKETYDNATRNVKKRVVHVVEQHQ